MFNIERKLHQHAIESIKMSKEHESKWNKNQNENEKKVEKR